MTNAATNLGSRRIKEKQGFELVKVREGDFVEGRRAKEVSAPDSAGVVGEAERTADVHPKGLIIG